MKIVNVIPNILSGESNQDSQPCIAVNPSNPNEIVIAALTPDPDPGLPPNLQPNAPIFVSTDGGDSWNFKNIVPNDSQPSNNGISLKYGAGTNNLYATALIDPDYNLEILRTIHPQNGATMTALDQNFGLIPQAWVVTATVPGGPDAGNDRIFIGINDASRGDGKTSLIRQTMQAQTAVPVFSTIPLDSRDKTPSAFAGINPTNGAQVRPAVNKDGTVYALFYSWKSYSKQNGNALVTTDVVIVRDDYWGMSVNPYTALKDSGDGMSGQRIVTNVSNYLEGPITNLGQDTLNGDLAIVVDPMNSSIVYVCWGDYQNQDYQLHLRRSLDRGQTWSPDLLTVINGKNPGLAINDSGQLCFLYQQLQGSMNNQTWETHLGFYAGAMWNDVLLAKVPAGTPPVQSQSYLGDYADIMAVGKTFYGVFSANNTPDLQNFPQGVKYHRNVDFNSKLLLGADAKTPIPPSIDPFFFSTEFIPPIPMVPSSNIASVLIILFGIIGGGGGAYIDRQGHIHIDPPGDPGPVWSYLVNLAEFRLAQSIPGKGGLELQKQALQNIVSMANEQIAQITGELKNG